MNKQILLEKLSDRCTQWKFILWVHLLKTCGSSSENAPQKITTRFKGPSKKKKKNQLQMLTGFLTVMVNMFQLASVSQVATSPSLSDERLLRLSRETPSKICPHHSPDHQEMTRVKRYWSGRSGKLMGWRDGGQEERGRKTTWMKVGERGARGGAEERRRRAEQAGEATSATQTNTVGGWGGDERLNIIEASVAAFFFFFQRNAVECFLSLPLRLSLASFERGSFYLLLQARLPHVQLNRSLTRDDHTTAQMQISFFICVYIFPIDRLWNGKSEIPSWFTFRASQVSFWWTKCLISRIMTALTLTRPLNGSHN